MMSTVLKSVDLEYSWVMVEPSNHHPEGHKTPIDKRELHLIPIKG